MKLTSIKNNFKLLTGRENDELVDFNQFKIHKDVLSPFKQLQKLAKEEVGVDLQIVSSFRNFDRQAIIWNEKVSGSRKVYDDLGNIVPKDLLPLNDYLKAIMRFSAVPGASRHHWGTDLDIFDASKMNKEDVQLTADECEAGGPCAELHSWLDEKINAHDAFSFFRPYKKDLGGVAIEKWHLSYAPIANQFFDEYTIDIFQQNIEQSEISAKELILAELEYYFKTFIANIGLSSP